MPRAALLLLLAAALLCNGDGVVVASAAGGDEQLSPNKPNFLWLHVESTDGRLYNDDSPVPIPNIRSVQARGVNFEQFYCNVPICCTCRVCVCVYVPYVWVAICLYTSNDWMGVYGVSIPFIIPSCCSNNCRISRMYYFPKRTVHTYPARMLLMAD